MYYLWFQVIVFQEYYNEGDAPIEAKYVFPLDDSAAGKYLWESDVSSIEMWVSFWHECAFLYQSVNSPIRVWNIFDSLRSPNSIAALSICNNQW